MRAIGIIVLILGVASLVLGVLLIPQAYSAEDEIAESIAPLPLDQVDPQYDAVKAKYTQMKESGAPPSVEYNYLTVQKTGLGLTRSQIGLASLTRTIGIVNIILGVGLILAGIGLMRKGQSSA
jgi:hypothetical protein